MRIRVHIDDDGRFMFGVSAVGGERWASVSFDASREEARQLVDDLEKLLDGIVDAEIERIREPAAEKAEEAK